MKAIRNQIAEKTANLRSASEIALLTEKKRPGRIQTAIGTFLYAQEALTRINQARTNSQTAEIDIARIRLHRGREIPPQKNDASCPLQLELLEQARARPAIVRKLEASSCEYQIVLGESAVLTHLGSRLEKIIVEVITLSDEDIEFLSRGSSTSLEAHFRMSYGKRQRFDNLKPGQFSS